MFEIKPGKTTVVLVIGGKIFASDSGDTARSEVRKVADAAGLQGGEHLTFDSSCGFVH